MSAIKHFRDLKVYQNAMATTMRVFELTKTFPAEEKLYLSEAHFREVDDACDQIIGQIVKIADQPEKWLIISRKSQA